MAHRRDWLFFLLTTAFCLASLAADASRAIDINDQHSLLNSPAGVYYLDSKDDPMTLCLVTVGKITNAQGKERENRTHAQMEALSELARFFSLTVTEQRTLNEKISSSPQKQTEATIDRQVNLSTHKDVTGVFRIAEGVDEQGNYTWVGRYNIPIAAGIPAQYQRFRNEKKKIENDLRQHTAERASAKRDSDVPEQETASSNAPSIPICTADDFL